jgi:hypothetical protein
MTTAVILQRARPAPVLDFELVRRGFLYFAIVMGVVAPFTREPVVTIGGAIVPWLIVRIVGTPTMPAAVLYLFLWQWMQIYTRVPVAWIDKETLGGGIYGPDVARAYWYMLASLLTMALAFRLVLARVKPPTRSQLTAHYKWQLNDVLMIYAASFAASMASAFLIKLSPGLAQVLDAVARLKVIGLMMLFIYCISTGRGMKWVVIVVLFEVAVGFTGFLSDFRAVFIYLGIAAVAARVKWKGSTTAGALIGATVLITLAIFWTSVKTDYRSYAAQSDESQEIKVPLGERMAYLGRKALAPQEIDLSDTFYALLSRLAYVDIFGSVIGVQEAAPEPQTMRQWTEAIEHVTQPRFLFPNKAALSDTDVYMRLARAYSLEFARAGTSISVGYMAENFADLKFPGMLLGIFVLGLMLAFVIKVMLGFRLPQIMIDGIVMGFIFSMARDGVEVSLPKVLGGMMLFFMVTLLMNKFLFPRVVHFLDSRAAAAGNPASSRRRTR